jgi:hypothetical protein
MANSRTKYSVTSRIGNDDREIAMASIELGLTAFEEQWRIYGAVERLAPFLALSARQLRGWRYRSAGYAGPEERHKIRMGVANALRWLADYYELRAQHWRRIADQQEFEEKQLSLWRNEKCERHASPKGRAA